MCFNDLAKLTGVGLHMSLESTTYILPFFTAFTEEYLFHTWRSLSPLSPIVTINMTSGFRTIASSRPTLPEGASRKTFSAPAKSR